MALYRYTWRAFAREIVLLVVALAFAAPLYVMLVLSLKSNLAVFTRPLSFPSDPAFGNYPQAWKGTAGFGMERALLNSVVITVGTVVLLIALGSLCAYTIARRESKLSTGLYLMFVAGIILPFQLGVISLYVVIRELGLTGSYLGMILVYASLLMPVTVMLYTGFIRTLPPDYEEAAQVDGAGVFRTFFRVVLPLLRPITGTVAVLTGVFSWNEFFLPLIFMSGSANQPLPVAIYSFAAEQASQWNVLFAAVAIAVAPMILFYFFAQRQLIKGFGGGIRG